MLSLLNPDIPMSEDMEDALNWFCAKCQARSYTLTNEDEVRAFLRDEEGRPDLAEQFTPNLLYLLPEDAE